MAVYVAAITLMMPFTFAETLGERTLQYGIKGEDVKELQIILNQLGYEAGENDGVYGEQTQNAVNEFKLARNLNNDGVADGETVRSISSNSQVETSRGSSTGEPTRYKQSMNIVATAYAPGPHDNGKWGNLTHVGTKVRPGIIAVDPQIIPLGSRVYIQYPDGHGVYAIAEDTGGAIKGNRIDIAVWTVDEAYQFGIQNVKVYVL